jgi:outer membrane protein OmpA-like peptidoglycan-associated protein
MNLLLKNIIIVLLLSFNFVYAKDVIISSSTVSVNIDNKALEKEKIKEEKRKKEEEKKRIKEEKKAKLEKEKQEKAVAKIAQLEKEKQDKEQLEKEKIKQNEDQKRIQEEKKAQIETIKAEKIAKQEKLKADEENIKLEEKNRKEIEKKEKNFSNNLKKLNEKNCETKQKEDQKSCIKNEEIKEEKIEKIKLAEVVIDKIEDTNIRAMALDENSKLKPIYFDSNSVIINNEYQKVLNSNIDYLKSTQYYRVLIVGYTDKIGKKEYNIKLGQDRANKIKKYLILAGIDSSKIETISFGEESSTYNFKNDKDRKVEIFIYKN